MAIAVLLVVDGVVVDSFTPSETLIVTAKSAFTELADHVGVVENDGSHRTVANGMAIEGLLP